MAGDIEVAAGIAIKRYEDPGLSTGKQLRNQGYLTVWLKQPLCDINKVARTVSADEEKMARSNVWMYVCCRG